VHDEGERQVLVDHLDIKLLAADPARRDVEDRGDVVVDGRKEVAASHRMAGQTAAPAAAVRHAAE